MNTQTTLLEYASLSATRTRGVSKAKRAFVRIRNSMRARHLERKTVQELSSLPSYILRDIGMTSDGIRAFAAELAQERAKEWARQAEAENGFGG